MSNRRTVEWWNGVTLELMELTDLRIVEWWNGGLGGAVESSNDGTVELVELVELSNRRLSNGGMVERCMQRWCWCMELSIRRMVESVESNRFVEWWNG